MTEKRYVLFSTVFQGYHNEPWLPGVHCVFGLLGNHAQYKHRFKPTYDKAKPYKSSTRLSGLMEQLRKECFDDANGTSKYNWNIWKQYSTTKPTIDQINEVFINHFSIKEIEVEVEEKDYSIKFDDTKKGGFKTGQLQGGFCHLCGMQVGVKYKNVVHGISLWNGNGMGVKLCYVCYEKIVNEFTNVKKPDHYDDLVVHQALHNLG